MRQRDGRIRIYPLTAALEFVSITRSSTEVHSFVVETIGTSSISGSSWTQKCVREMQDSKNQSSHRCFRIRLRNSPLHRGTLLRCRDDRWFIFRQILTQVIVKKFAPSDLIRIAHLRLRLRNLRFPRNEERAPRETSGGHGCQ